MEVSWALSRVGGCCAGPVVLQRLGVHSGEELGQPRVDDRPGVEDRAGAAGGQPVVGEVGQEAGGPGVGPEQVLVGARPRGAVVVEPGGPLGGGPVSQPLESDLLLLGLLIHLSQISASGKLLEEQQHKTNLKVPLLYTLIHQME